MFISLEGIEGCGKTTIARRLAADLAAAGHGVELLRDPGDTPLGEQVRQMLLHSTDAIDPTSELLLFGVARRQLVVERIEPALAGGRIVLCDRFFDSTAAYQGYGRGLSQEKIAWLRRAVCVGCEPDLTVVLDIDPALGLARAAMSRGPQAVGPDRMEASGEAFMARVREGFWAIARQEPERLAIVSVTGTVDETLAAVGAVLQPRLAAAGLAVPAPWRAEEPA